MGSEEIRFSDKRIDEGWKERVSSEKDKIAPSEQAPEAKSTSRSQPAPQKTNPLFVQLLSSLAMQALIQLGEIENPGSGSKMQDVEGARETIDLILALKEKSVGNLSKEEEKLMDSAVSDLQMKYVQVAGL